MLKARFDFACAMSSLFPLVPCLMEASVESRRMRTSNKETISDVITSIPVRGDDCEQIHPTNSKILRRATLKIDFCLIPIMGMFCVPSSQRSCLSAHILFRPFVTLGEWFDEHLTVSHVTAIIWL
jgi:hypothetical protein